MIIFNGQQLTITLTGSVALRQALTTILIDTAGEAYSVFRTVTGSRLGR